MGPARRGTRIPTIVFHGDADPTVHPDNADAIVKGLLDGAELVSRSRSTRPASDDGAHAYTTITYRDSRDRNCVEHWIIHDGGHAWSGGCAAGSHTDPHGPDATGAMLRFFRSHRLEPRCTQSATR
jgi:poly(3-hydroxybutyrate) depolymerase